MNEPQKQWLSMSLRDTERCSKETNCKQCRWLLARVHFCKWLADHIPVVWRPCHFPNGDRKPEDLHEASGPAILPPSCRLLVLNVILWLPVLALWLSSPASECSISSLTLRLKYYWIRDHLLSAYCMPCIKCFMHIIPNNYFHGDPWERFGDSLLLMRLKSWKVK